MKTWSWMVAVFCVSWLAWADVVFCKTGDQLHGKVISLDEKEVRLRSEIAGELKIPRERVISISFVEMAKAPAITNAGTNGAALKPAGAADANKLDSAAIAKVQQDFLATATPEAQAMYRDMVQGFMSGKLSVQDLRGQAQDALNQLNELSKDLDDEEISGILGSYGAILQNFLKQSGGAVTNVPPAHGADASADEE